MQRVASNLDLVHRALCGRLPIQNEACEPNTYTYSIIVGTHVKW
jgi:hypothetical protein